MNNIRHIIAFSFVMVLVLGSLALPSLAATNVTLAVTNTSIGATCTASTFQIAFGWTANVGDLVDGNDGVGMIAFDANGVSIAAGWNGWPVGSTSTEVTPFGGGQGINAITMRPITIQVFDIAGAFPPFGENTQAIYDDIAGRGAPIVASMTYDPAAADPNCSSLPLGPVAGCDMQIALPATAVVGSFVANAEVHWAPGSLVKPVITIPAGKTAWVLGLDESGAYRKILWSCDFLWVPAETMGPNYDDVWNGRPLPTDVVD